MSDAKNTGKVKWFSIRKGFGFITPSNDSGPTKGEDIFFHQTSIVSEAKNKFLETNYEVEYEVYTDDDGKYKCKQVTKPGGGPCDVPERKQNNRRRGKGGKADGDAKEDNGDKKEGDKKEEEKKDDGEEKNGQNKNKKGGKGRNNNRGKGKPGANAEKKEGENGEDGKKPAGGGGGRKPRKRFDDGISQDVKNKMKEKKLDMRQTSLLVVLEKNRIKFGPDGYAALCHADGIMAEGSFVCDDQGKVTLTWKNMLKFTGGEWKQEDPIANTSNGVLVDSFNWSDDKVEGLKQVESPESLWGDDKTDPADALQSNNFQMRKCFLAKTQANPRNRRRPRNRGGKKGGDGKENGKNGENGKTAEVAAS